MWTRRELKAKAKQAFKRNYWKTVLIALVFTLVCSGAGAFGAGAGAGGRSYDDSAETTAQYSPTNQELEERLQELNDIDLSDPDDPKIEEVTHTIDLVMEGETEGEQEIVGEAFGHPVRIPVAGLLAVGGIVLVLFLVVFTVALALEAFLANPVEVGTARFFTTNLNQAAEVKEVAFGFDHNYLQTVKTLFWRDIYTMLWALLLIVPGVVKAYEYRMIAYLLADDPTLTKEEAFAESKRLMDGNKWRAFVLDLSFIGWYLLAIPTLGLASIFYVSPYKKMTDAALYEELRYGQGGRHSSAALPTPDPVVTPAGSSVPVPPFAAADAPAPNWDEAAE